MPIPAQTTTSRRRSRYGGVMVVLYLGIVAAAFAIGRAWLDELATLMVATLLFWPGLRRGQIAAIAIWVLVVLVVAALAFAGHGETAL
ncbi:MAG TPA: hypothetical protein VJ696_05900, partial [Rhodanobacteraceae bacterium]|nr:hypothetical protein [Rhodanobacteraceae bacterium]